MFPFDLISFTSLIGINPHANFTQTYFSLSFFPRPLKIWPKSRIWFSILNSNFNFLISIFHFILICIHNPRTSEARPVCSSLFVLYSIHISSALIKCTSTNHFFLQRIFAYSFRFLLFGKVVGKVPTIHTWYLPQAMPVEKN